MPIRYTDKGWFWGSKGPFISKAKAIQVSRAAHANGFKEENEMTNDKYAEFALTLLHSVTNAHILHLRADTISIHLAMGEFYIEIGELADTFIEAYQGKYGKINDYGNQYDVPPLSPIEYMVGLMEYVSNTRTQLPQDTYLQNIIDEVAQSIASTLNKLRFYK